MKNPGVSGKAKLTNSSEVSKELNVSPATITIKCNKFPKEYKGYYWKRIS